MLQGGDMYAVLANTCFYITILLYVYSTQSGLHFLKFQMNLLALWFSSFYCWSGGSVYINQR